MTSYSIQQGSAHWEVSWQHVLLFIRLCIGEVQHCNASGHGHADSQASKEDAAVVLQRHVQSLRVTPVSCARRHLDVKVVAMHAVVLREAALLQRHLLLSCFQTTQLCRAKSGHGKHCPANRPRGEIAADVVQRCVPVHIWAPVQPGGDLAALLLRPGTWHCRTAAVPWLTVLQHHPHSLLLHGGALRRHRPLAVLPTLNTCCWHACNCCIS